MTSLGLDAVSKRFGDTAALDRVSLDFPAGSLTALLGPSGCGKTTLLRLIAGFEAPSEGEVRFDGQVVATASAQLPPEKRGVGVVFQSYALWPHMDVAGNIAYPLKTIGTPGAGIAKKVADVLDIVGLPGFEARRIDELSGGQRQRVALARCLVAGTRIILFDEPLANLDMHLRASMLEAFRAVHQRTAATIVYVTHDQSEALALAGRIAVLDQGRLQQLGTPEQIYRSPANAMVAGFVGRGAIVAAEVAGGKASIAGHGFAVRGDTGSRVLLRPEALALAKTGIPATVTTVTYTGPSYELQLALAGTGEKLVVDSRDPVGVGTAVHIAVGDAWAVPA
jgi:iron(III) transport system ATP-binding protein